MHYEKTINLQRIKCTCQLSAASGQWPVMKIAFCCYKLNYCIDLAEKNCASLYRINLLMFTTNVHIFTTSLFLEVTDGQKSSKAKCNQYGHWTDKRLHT